METPWQRARSASKRSRKQEERLGNLPNSQRQPNSGRGRFGKRDARVFGDFLTEARTTEKKSYAVQADEFRDLTAQAIRNPPGCLPAMALEIDGLRLFVVREVDLEDILVRLMSYEEDENG